MTHNKRKVRKMHGSRTHVTHKPKDVIWKSERWWEKEPLRMFRISFTNTSSDYDFDYSQRAEKLKDMGVNVTGIFAVGGHVNDRKLYFKTSLSKRANVDLLAAYLPELHKREIRATVYFNGRVAELEFAKEHPDWQQIREDGTPKADDFVIDVALCVNSPWREWVFQAVRDLLKYDIDGIFFDSTAFLWDTCYCRSCREKFRKRYGEEMPLKSKRKDPCWRRLIEFQVDSLTEFLGEAQKIIKGANANVVVYQNFGGHLWASWLLGRDARKVTQVTDILASEAGLLRGDLNQSPLWKVEAVAKLIETQAGGKPTMIFSAAIHKPWAYRFLPLPEIKLLFAQTVANGAYPWQAFRYGFAPETRPEVNTIKECYTFLGRNAQYYRRASSAAKVALLWSEQTRVFHSTTDDGGSASEAPQLSWFGLYEALVRSHIPFDVIDEPALTREYVDRYEVVILPRSICLSGIDVENIRSYIKRGGNIISTSETSLCNEYGEAHGGLQLADVFGLKYLGETLGPLEYDHIATLDIPQGHPLFKGITKRWLAAPKYGFKVTPTTGRVYLGFCGKQLGLSGASRPPSLPPELNPAVIVNHYGQGKCIYFAGTFGEDYWAFRHIEYRLLFKNSINWLSKPMIILENAPASLGVVVRRQTEPSRWLVHLINYNGGMSRPIERIIPCQNVKVSLRGVEKVSQVTTLWSERELAYTVFNNEVGFTVPQIEEYEVAVIE